MGMHMTAHPIGYYDEFEKAVENIWLRLCGYSHVTIFADPYDGPIYLFGPNNQKASLYEVKHPAWLVGVYTPRVPYRQIADDLRAHRITESKRHDR